MDCRSSLILQWEIAHRIRKKFCVNLRIFIAINFDKGQLIFSELESLILNFVAIHKIVIGLIRKTDIWTSLNSYCTYFDIDKFF